MTDNRQSSDGWPEALALAEGRVCRDRLDDGRLATVKSKSTAGQLQRLWPLSSRTRQWPARRRQVELNDGTVGRRRVDVDSGQQGAIESKTRAASAKAAGHCRVRLDNGASSSRSRQWPVRRRRVELDGYQAPKPPATIESDTTMTPGRRRFRLAIVETDPAMNPGRRAGLDIVETDPTMARGYCRAGLDIVRANRRVGLDNGLWSSSSRTRQWPGVIVESDSTLASRHRRVELDNALWSSSSRTRQRPGVIVESDSTVAGGFGACRSSCSTLRRLTGHCRLRLDDALLAGRRVRLDGGGLAIVESDSTMTTGHCQVRFDNDRRPLSSSTRQCPRRVRLDGGLCMGGDATWQHVVDSRRFTILPGLRCCLRCGCSELCSDAARTSDVRARSPLRYARASDVRVNAPPASDALRTSATLLCSRRTCRNGKWWAHNTIYTFCGRPARECGLRGVGFGTRCLGGISVAGPTFRIPGKSGPSIRRLRARIGCGENRCRGENRCPAGDDSNPGKVWVVDPSAEGHDRVTGELVPRWESMPRGATIRLPVPSAAVKTGSAEGSKGLSLASLPQKKGRCNVTFASTSKTVALLRHGSCIAAPIRAFFDPARSEHDPTVVFKPMTVVVIVSNTTEVAAPDPAVVFKL
ncbi:hypothetical protein CBR_g46259 [Chara braunii]|uniref:Uncharacterized protein n=1 Tax=Chara braunii TaxID=69332 RepID=A0A388K3X3_CHABU|nr:hypothetical protein CBR_g46259 [Chara braunii]|eukprot:GBG64716.1 hypothetical protein CBR_g46259 [Chara braunii]